VASLTLAIDDELLKRARIRALEQDTSVNSLVRDYLKEFATGGAQPAGIAAFLELAESIRAGSGPDGRTWTRDELYDR
jgi:plasmid stability protein